MIRYRPLPIGRGGQHAALAAATLGIIVLAACGSNTASAPAAAPTAAALTVAAPAASASATAVPATSAPAASAPAAATPTTAAAPAASASAVSAPATSAPAAAVLTPVPPSQLRTSTPPTPHPDVTAAAAAGPVVAIDNFSFAPATIAVPIGTTVTWMNRDSVPHTVTASDKSFGSPPIDSNTQFSNTFTTAGAFTYFCSIHPFMTATVIVQ